MFYEKVIKKVILKYFKKILLTFFIIGLILSSYSLLFGLIYLSIPLAISFFSLLITSNKKKGLFVFLLLFIALLICVMLYGYAGELKFNSKADLAAAIWDGNPKLVRQKIKEGFDVNSNNNGFTMLTLAFNFWYGPTRWQHGHWRFRDIGSITYDITNILVDHGADINKIDDNFGLAPIHYVVSRSLITLETREKILNYLLENGANVDLPTEKGFTPLHLLCEESGSIRLAKILLDYDADINALNNDGKTPLQLAVDKAKEFPGFNKIANYLLKNGAK